MTAGKTLEALILGVIRETAVARGLELSDLGPHSPVDQRLGLDSLDWAAVVVRLELETGLDPFVSGPVGELRTVADIVALYTSAC
jgi:acyl carrier protein